jgi:hypothetical protein
MNHKIGRAVFATIVGIAAVMFSFNWISDTDRRAQREAEELAVLAARELLAERVGEESLEIVDPLSPDRVVGKGYIYVENDGWAVSGFYRRGEADSWHPYLLVLTAEHEVRDFKSDDDALR